MLPGVIRFNWTGSPQKPPAGDAVYASSSRRPSCKVTRRSIRLASSMLWVATKAASPVARVGLMVLDQVVNGQPNVPRNLPEQDWRNIPALMERHGGASSSAVTKLFMRTTLPDLREPKLAENCDDLCWLEHGDAAHSYATETFWIPTNSDSSSGSPSSSSIVMTSRRL